MKERFSAPQLREDLAYFVRTLEEVHPDPYFSLPQTEFAQLRDTTSKTLTEPLSQAEFFKRIAPLASALNDEHVAITIPDEEFKRHAEAGGPVFPFPVLFAANKAYVAATEGREGRIPAGAQVLAINGVQMPDLIHELTRCVSGTRPDQRLAILERRYQPLFYLTFDFDRSFEIVYRAPDAGGEQALTLPGIPQETVNGPWFSYRALPGEATAVIKFDEFAHLKKFKAFLRDAFQQIQDRGIAHLIIDIRDNAGGASAVGDVLLSYLTDKPFQQFSRADFKVSKGLKDNLRQFIPAFIRWLPVQYLHPMTRKAWQTPEGEIAAVEFGLVKPGKNALRFSGDVYVLISPYVMSSASFLAATVKEYGIGTLVGQETGGSPTNYGNVWKFPLPHSGLVAEIPSSMNYGHGTGPVVPHHVVEEDIARRAQGVDLELELTRKLIAERRAA